jgi:hypothetical protein
MMEERSLDCVAHSIRRDSSIIIECIDMMMMRRRRG